MDSEAASSASSALSDLVTIIYFCDNTHLSWTSWSFTWSPASLLRASLAAFLASSLSALAFLTFSSPNLCSTRSLDSSVFTSRFSLSHLVSELGNDAVEVRGRPPGLSPGGGRRR